MANLGSENTPIEGESFGLPSGYAVDEENGDLVIRDTDGTVAMRRADGTWELESDLALNENDISGVGAFDSESVNTEEAQVGSDGEVGNFKVNGAVSDRHFERLAHFDNNITTPWSEVIATPETRFFEIKIVYTISENGGAESPTPLKLRMNEDDSPAYDYLSRSSAGINTTTGDSGFTLATMEPNRGVSGTHTVMNCRGRGIVYGNAVSHDLGHEQLIKGKVENFIGDTESITLIIDDGDFSAPTSIEVLWRAIP